MKLAFLIIDVRNKYFLGNLPATYPLNSPENVLAAMDATQAMGVPVVSSTPPRRDRQPSLRAVWARACTWRFSRQPRVLYRGKRLLGSFTNTNLEARLFAQGMDKVAVWRLYGPEVL
jgi:hypothetical protein